ncbi:hypothetical protein ACMX9J_14320 [Priestia sp. RMT2NF4]|uniref:hypothetical protein n=1 Tax=Priestia sp. RMT2NF4 TaxID=3398394 RepID=UPI003A4C66A3
MRRVLMESAVDMLLDNYNSAEFREVFFMRALDYLIYDNEVNLLADIPLLVEVIYEKNAHFLIEPLRIYDRLASEEIEKLLA